MTTNAEAPEVTNFVQQWMMAEAGIAPDPEPEPEPATRPDEYSEYIAPIVERRKNWPDARAAILAATGQDVVEAPVIEDRPDYQPASQPQATQATAEPAEWPIAPPVTAEQAPGPAERHARTWRERNGLPRKKARLSPSQGTAGRRARYAAKRAAELGISFDEAMAGIRQRPQMTRTGRRTAAQAATSPESSSSRPD